MDSSAPASRVNNSTWDVKPISNPGSAKWNISLSADDTAKLVTGYAPKGMEDRWMACADGPDEKGNIAVHVYRSWTGHEKFEIKAKISDPDGNPSSSAKADITDIIWDKGLDGQISEQDAKDLARTICKNVIGCELEATS